MFPLIQLPKKFREYVFGIVNNQDGEFPLIQLPKKFRAVSTCNDVHDDLFPVSINSTSEEV